MMILIARGGKKFLNQKDITAVEQLKKTMVPNDKSIENVEFLPK